ncbi:efflux RND transporter periplasmic adaptor subunit [Bacillus halotolerans]|uniref:Efflux RND transporter periplasmic adaptor subunit n=1 Tax=Bacillus halotolerans TaxID=260554 RepID=A0ABY7I5G1_9BACI|nr:efflux RND transporter periplasmic adaptor subunit [Bacillus halotolerans]KUP33607.1 efflux transporter periplasmic adaptor subunit [Bacillus halotolerans]MBL4964782.1 efflux RND transporter periplasmic adaptor subunit [Bacillus halotolerans]MBL4968327.1 efflux RND transporter periplasmic adaptor subunit [Bacillus halotolerans]MBL4972388.1 efflux RND transporter periplasmic adaptor subunit [Bacillus halotolerans]MDG0765736.1 efflux RND transporter periplasmic adaptor subunit [Bacillus halot
MKKVWIGIGIAALAALFIGINIYRSAAPTSGSAGQKVETGSLEEKKISSTVMVPGTLKFSNEQYVFYEADKGTLNDIKVKEGDKVKKGTPLVTYTNEQLSLEKEQNQLTSESNRLQIDQIQEKLQALDSKEKELTKQLGKKEAEKQVDSERTELEMQEKTAQIELKQTELQRQSLANQVSDLQVKSEIEGTVISVNQEAASKKSDIQEPVIHIGNPKDLVVSGKLSEYDTLKVKKGQKVTLTSDVIQDKTWKGTVSAVGLVPDQQDNAAAAAGTDQAVQYPLQVKIKGDLPEGKPGFKFIMNIETDKRKTNTLPSKAVKKEDDQYYVYTVKDGKAKRVDVKIGEVTDDVTEIKEGISKDDQVILNPADDLADGTEVKA